MAESNLEKLEADNLMLKEKALNESSAVIELTGKCSKKDVQLL